MTQPKIEKFTGTTLEAALELISQKWGPEAAILHVERQSTPGGLLSAPRQWVEITAQEPAPKVHEDRETPAAVVPILSSAIHKPELMARGGETPCPPEGFSERMAQVEQGVGNAWTASDRAGSIPHPILNYLVSMGMDSRDAEELVSDWSKKNPDMDLSECMADLDRRIPRLGWKEVFPQGKSRCTLLLGLPGVGKTLLLIKMAARLKLIQKSDVLILSGDLSRAGPSQELELYREILGVPVVQIFDLRGIREAIREAKSDTHILVDWGGISPYEENSWRQLEFLREGHPHPQIILAASLVSDLQMWKRVQERFSNLPMAGLALTQADLEFRLGKIWEGVRTTHLPLAFISTGKNVPGDVCEGTGFPFGRLLFKNFGALENQNQTAEVFA